MIPKIIHYCWLGGAQMGEREKACIDSWRVLMPEYELRLWNEDNFDIHSIPWVEQACEEKKWAFATDYIRQFALYNFGGIYMDTDIRLLKSLDKFTVHRGFGGIEYLEHSHTFNIRPGILMSSGVFGAEKGHPIIKRFMDYYTDRNFIRNNGSMDLTPNTRIMPEICKEYGFVYDPFLKQVLDGDFHIYPYDYFTMQIENVGDVNITHNSHAIHLFSQSWEEPIRHSRFTWLRQHTKEFLRNFWDDVVMGKRCRKKIKK